jgi:heparan-alpha-glucosaminide N-acetyltransferase
MTATVAAEAPPASTTKKVPSASGRITSIDALRGFVMFTMIYVNDIAGAPHRLIPDWMVHFSDRHRGGSGMTFVDLVFPAFLFIVGMSIPFALGSRLAKGEPLWKIAGHVLARTAALLAIGILMVNGESAARGNETWSPALWSYTMFVSCIFAFCTIAPPAARRPKFWKWFTVSLRAIGFGGMLYCALMFQGRRNNAAVLELFPLRLHTSWYGILGLIGWAYLAAAMVYLLFRNHRTALLGCVALLFCFYPADRKDLFSGFWFTEHVIGFADTLGSHGAIATAGVLLASILVASDMKTHSARTNFTLLFSGGFAAAALLVSGLYGISKNNATPSWCFWACAITALLWLGFYYLCDVGVARVVGRPLAIAGQNVLLAYLLSEMLPDLLRVSDFHMFGHTLANPVSVLMHGAGAVAVTAAIACSAAWSVLLLAVTAGLNRAGFRLKL